MNLPLKLAEWRREGLLDAETAARIEAYEARPRRSYLLYAIGGLGALSVGIGLLSIVASNWEAIPAGLKLVLDFVLLGGLAAGVWRSEAKSWAREVLIFVFYGAVLASIGLVGQVYHLGGALETALLFWALITTPVVLHAHGRVLAATWILALEVTLLLHLERLYALFTLSEIELATLTICYLVSLALVGASGSERLRRARPALAGVAGVFGCAQLLAAVTLAPLGWYTRSDSWHGPPAPGLAALCLIAMVGGSLLVAGRDEASRGPGRGALLAVAVAAPILSALPWLSGHDKLGFLAAASFLVVWSLVGFLAHRLGRVRLLNLATALLGVRLLIIYFEVFGSLLDTGIGLLSGGVLTLGLAWAWLRWARRSSAAAGEGREDE
jgi:uncharacterized membrane protein